MARPNLHHKNCEQSVHSSSRQRGRFRANATAVGSPYDHPRHLVVSEAITLDVALATGWLGTSTTDFRKENGFSTTRNNAPAETNVVATLTNSRAKTKTALRGDGGKKTPRASRTPCSVRP